MGVLRHCDDVGMANIAPIVNTPGPLYVHPGGIVKRTTFHTLAMYANLLERRVCGFNIQASPLAHGDRSIPVVDPVATVDESNGNWAIAVVNRYPEHEMFCTGTVGNWPLEGQYAAKVLAGDSADAYNDIEHPERVVPTNKDEVFRDGAVSLPPHSLTIIRMSLEAQVAAEAIGGTR